MYQEKSEEEYDLEFLEAKRDLAIMRWENPQYWEDEDSATEPLVKEE